MRESVTLAEVTRAIGDPTGQPANGVTRLELVPGTLTVTILRNDGRVTYEIPIKAGEFDDE